MAQGQPSGNPDAKWGPHIDFEAKPGSKRNLGEADLFIPLAQDARTLVFASVRGRFDNHSSREGNLGGGVRHMLPSGWNLGAYGYLDRRRSDTGNYFNQATLGAEALGRDWDFRANGYLPIGTRVRDLGEASSAAISGASVQVTTTAREERALKGYDAEAGWRVPFFDAEDHSQLRLYYGRYRFADDVISVSGPRLRAEFALAQVPGLWQGAQLFLGAETQDDSARGSQNFLSIRLRISLDGKKERPRQLTAQERRMTAPIMRDVDIVTQSRVSSTLVETATTAGGQAITVFNSSTTAGNALAAAVAGAPANSTIVLSGTFNVSGLNTVVVDGGRTLRAGTTTVRTASGREAVLTTSATVAGTNVNSSTVQLVNNATLAGVTVSSTYNNGTGGYAVLLAGGAGNITLLNNTITVSQSGANGADALIFGGNNANVLVSGNTLTATGSGAATTMTALAANNLTITTTITGNTLSASGGNTANYMAWLNGQTTIKAGSTGNIRGSGTCNGATASGSIGFTNGSTCP